MRGKGMLFVVLLVLLAVPLAACAPTAAPTPTPTVAPAPAPTKAAEATKPPAPSPTPLPAATPTPRPATLKFGGVQVVSEGGVYVAIEKGYFKEQGITMEVTNFRISSEAIAPMGTGQLDITNVPVSVPLLAAADRGLDLKVVAGVNQYRPNWENGWIVLRKDLKDSGQVKTPADLKGMKVATPSLAGLGEQLVQLLLEQGGLKPGEAEVVVLPFAEQVTAFANKAIAAGWATEPFIVRGIEQGVSVKWIPTSQFFGGTAQGSMIIFGPALSKDQDLARRWMVAYLKGARDYLKAFTTKEGRDEVVGILAKYTPTKDPKLYDLMEMPYLEPNGMPDKKSSDAQYQWFVDKGLYTGKKTMADITDLSFAEYAAQRLGRQ